MLPFMAAPARQWGSWRNASERVTSLRLILEPLNTIGLWRYEKHNNIIFKSSNSYLYSLPSKSKRDEDGQGGGKR